MVPASRLPSVAVAVTETSWVEKPCGEPRRGGHGRSLVDAPAGEVDGASEPSQLLDPPGETGRLVGRDQLGIATVGLALEDDVERARPAGPVRVGVLDD